MRLKTFLESIWSRPPLDSRPRLTYQPLLALRPAGMSAPARETAENAA